jgi:1D-myo-inositol-tetrakisphosphate 5-kinase/inositol-polyphosphate multikinase
MASTSTIIHPLESQVGGHAGVSTNESGSLMIKPAAPMELAFYERLQLDGYLEDLRPFTPTFLGTLKLMGKVDVSESIILESLAASEEKDESLVLLVSFSPDTYYYFF